MIPSVRIDLEDLLDAEQVAEVLGLSSARGVGAYRNHYEDFPAPVIERSSGRCQLWLRADVVQWRAAHPSRQTREV